MITWVVKHVLVVVDAAMEGIEVDDVEDKNLVIVVAGVGEVVAVVVGASMVVFRPGLEDTGEDVNKLSMLEMEEEVKTD